MKGATDDTKDYKFNTKCNDEGQKSIYSKKWNFFGALVVSSS